MEIKCIKILLSVDFSFGEKEREEIEWSYRESRAEEQFCL